MLPARSQRTKTTVTEEMDDIMNEPRRLSIWNWLKSGIAEIVPELEAAGAAIQAEAAAAAAAKALCPDHCLNDRLPGRCGAYGENPYGAFSYNPQSTWCEWKMSGDCGPMYSKKYQHKYQCEDACFGCTTDKSSFYHSDCNCYRTTKPSF